MHRRTFLTTTGATIALAGCLGSGDSGGDQPAETTDGMDDMATEEMTTGDMSSDEMTDEMDSDDSTEMMADDPLGGHPAAMDIGSQPALGPDPTSAPAVIVTFSDPSCPNCARFESETVPEIESKLVEEEKATFVYRNMPIIYPWGEPATQALEATFAHDEDAFWALKDHYYEEQSGFDEDNVFERTREFLAEETDVDAETVVSEAEAGEYDDAAQADLSAGEEAGVGATPTTFLFKEGEHVTTVNGPKSYTVIAEALDV